MSTKTRHVALYRPGLGLACYRARFGREGYVVRWCPRRTRGTRRYCVAGGAGHRCQGIRGRLATANSWLSAWTIIGSTAASSGPTRPVAMDSDALPKPIIEADAQASSRR